MLHQRIPEYCREDFCMRRERLKIIHLSSQLILQSKFKHCNQYRCHRFREDGNALGIEKCFPNQLQYMYISSYISYYIKKTFCIIHTISFSKHHYLLIWVYEFYCHLTVFFSFFLSNVAISMYIIYLSNNHI